MEHVTIEALRSDGAGVLSGPVGMMLLQNDFNPNILRTNDVLRKEEWLLFDREVVTISRQRLVAVGDLISRGLTFALPNALGTTVLQWEQETDINPAEVTMTGLAPAQRDRPTWDLLSMPIPIIHKDFSVNARALASSRRYGTPLDTTMAAKAARMVAEKTEDILFNGVANLVVNGGQIYGYRNFPHRVTGNLGSDWANASTTGTNIVADIIAMMEAAAAVHMYGPYMIYVPQAAFIHMQDDHKANSDLTIWQRLKELPNIIDIKPTEALPGGTNCEVLMVQMTSDVVQMVDGMQPTTLSWPSNGGMTTNFKVMSIMVPRIKYDAAGQCGVVHFTKP
jgi:uncharacterized linocin/CFP29 family protein